MDGRANDLAARNIRRLRGERGMSLGELSRRAGVAKQTLSKVEAGDGNPTLDTLDVVARALDVGLTALLTQWGTPVFVQRDAPETWQNEQSWQVRPLDQVYGSGYVRTSLMALGTGTDARVEIAPHSAGTLHHAFVLAGRVRMGPIGELVDLGPGDFIRYPGDVDHVMERIGRRTVIHVVTTAPQVTQVSPAGHPAGTSSAQ